MAKREREREERNWESSEREKTLEGRRLEQIQSRMGRASSYWKGHSKLSGSNPSAPWYPNSPNNEHSLAPLILCANLIARSDAHFNFQMRAGERESETDIDREFNFLLLCCTLDHAHQLTFEIRQKTRFNKCLKMSGNVSLFICLCIFRKYYSKNEKTNNIIGNYVLMY
jgi:hypothetical protein